MSEKKGVFAGKVVIVTGSSSGIGQATAVVFGREGASVVIHGQDTGRLQGTQDMMVAEGVDPARILQVIGSMEADETPDKIYTATIEKFQRIDVLVNNAGAVIKPGTKDANDMENLDFIYRVNFRSPVELMRLCLPELEKSRGNIVNVSSIGSTMTFSGGMNYGSMKAALDHVTRNYANQYGPKGVRINCLNPGPIDTYIFERMGVVGDARAAFDKQVEETAALGRWGKPSEMSECIKFLASDAASYVTGTCLVADGGCLIYNRHRVDTAQDKKGSSD